MANNKQSAGTERCPIDLMDASSYVKSLMDSNATLGLPPPTSRDMLKVGANCGPAGCGVWGEMEIYATVGSIGFKTPEDLLRKIRTAIKKKNKGPRVHHFSVNGSLSEKKGIKIQTVELCKPTLSQNAKLLEGQISAVGEFLDVANINIQDRTAVVQNGVINYDLLETEPLELEEEILQPVEFRINVQLMSETRAKSIVEPIASSDISCPKTENLGTEDIKPDVRLKLDINENTLKPDPESQSIVPDDVAKEALATFERIKKGDCSEKAETESQRIVPEAVAKEALATFERIKKGDCSEKAGTMAGFQRAQETANPIPEDGCTDPPARSVSPSSFRIPEKKAKLEDQVDQAHNLGFPIDSCTDNNLEQLSDEEVATETATNCLNPELTAIAPQAEVLEADDDPDILELCVDASEFD